MGRGGGLVCGSHGMGYELFDFVPLVFDRQMEPEESDLGDVLPEMEPEKRFLLTFFPEIGMISKGFYGGMRLFEIRRGGVYNAEDRSTFQSISAVGK